MGLTVTVTAKAGRAPGGLPRPSPRLWLLRRLGPPPQPPRRYFAKTWTVTSSRR
jgi:hypothetical protein